MTLKGNPLYDSDQLKVKILNPSKNISPIEVSMEIIKQEENRPVEFQSHCTRFMMEKNQFGKVMD